MKDANELRNALSQFTCTEGYFFNPINRNIHYTDGAAFFFENAGGGAYWLLDILLTQPEILKPLKTYHFLVVQLVVTDDMRAVLTVANDTGSDATVYYRLDLDYTDCPVGEWMLYMLDHVILLPSEYRPERGS